MGNVLPITVIITTYDPGEGERLELATETFKSLKKYLAYPELKWIIADDGSPEHIRQELQNLGEVTLLNSERKGVGVSKNNALAVAFKTSPLVLLLEDDWILENPFDLRPFADLLNNYSSVDMVRFGYIGGEMSANYTSFGPESYWILNQGTGVYVYSGQVSLRHKRFYDKVGFHEVGIAPGAEELEMCKRYNGTENAGLILWPAKYPCTFNSGPFKNIGTGTLSLNDIQPES